MSGGRAQGPHGLGKLLRNIATDFQELLRGEIRLARSELDQKLQQIIMAVIWLLGGALVAFAGLVVVFHGGAAALALALPTWAASLIIGVLIVAVGALFARSGLSMLSLKILIPGRIASSLQKDVDLVKEHV